MDVIMFCYLTNLVFLKKPKYTAYGCGHILSLLRYGHKNIHDSRVWN